VRQERAAHGLPCPVRVKPVATHICMDDSEGNGNAQREARMVRRLIEFGGEALTATQWSKRLGITLQAFQARRARWPVKRVFAPKKSSVEIGQMGGAASKASKTAEQHRASARHAAGSIRMTEAEVDAHQRRIGRATQSAKKPVPATAKRVAKESAIEALFAQQIEAKGLPRPEREYKGAVIGRKYRLDFAWPDLKIAVECCGHVHRIRERFLADCERTCLLVLAGWRILPVSGDDVRSGRAVGWLAILLGRA